MPHLTLNALEDDIAGHELDLMSSVTGAVVDVYGEWVRAGVSVSLAGWPRHRWGMGGRPIEESSVSVTFGVREEMFLRADAGEVVERLVRGLTDAITSVLGDDVRERVMVELVATPSNRIGVGGVVGGRRRD